ncbi:MAG: pilus assembly protein PilM [Vicinamibacterales bacterium]
MSLFSLHDSRGPSAVIDIAGHRISGVRLEARGAALALAAHATEALPDGTLVPSLTAANVQNRGGLVRALTRVLEQIGRPKRIGLIVPDPVARVSLVKFQQVPARASELDQLIRWQMKKTLPFPLEEAQLSYSMAAKSPDGQEVLVSVARRDIVMEYESVCAEAGAYVGLVDVSTSGVLSGVMATSRGDERDCLVVNMARDWASLAVLRGGQVALLRSRASEGGETLADLVHQTTMFYEDRLQGAGFGRVLLCGAAAADAPNGAEAEGGRRGLEERLGTKVTAVDLAAALTWTDRTAADAALMDTLAPAIGLLLRFREVAA